MGMDAENFQSGGKTVTSGGTIAKGLLCKIGTTDNSAIVTTATSEQIVAVTTVAVVSGDVFRSPRAGDTVMAKAGGTVTRGVAQMFVTGGKCTDATGNVYVAGVALASAVDGDEFSLEFNPSRIGTA